MSAVEGNKALLTFPQVTEFDVMVSRIIVVTATQILNDGSNHHGECPVWFRIPAKRNFDGVRCSNLRSFVCPGHGNGFELAGCLYSGT